MAFRGTVIHGVVVPDAGQSLPEGTRVRLSPIRNGGGNPSFRKSPSRAKVSKPPRSVRKAKQHPLLALSGIWKDRPDWKGKSSTQIVAELRKSSGPRRG